MYKEKIIINRQYNNHGYEAEPQLVVDVMPLHSLQYLRSFNVFYIGLHYLSLLLLQNILT